MADIARLMREHGLVEEIRADDEFKRHMRERGNYAKHRVTITEILEAHANGARYFANPGGRAPVVLVGRTDAGRFLTVPIEPTMERGVWRPVTAYEANVHHRNRFLGGGG